jgi:hypothetical protein
MSPAAPASGYSGTPLVRKLGIVAGMCVCLRDAPPGYLDLLQPLPDGVRFVAEAGPDVDLVQHFATARATLESALPHLRAALRPEVPVWVSWPKRASRVPTDITEDVVRAVALPLGWVDIKVCAVDAVWSGLKLVVRTALR